MRLFRSRRIKRDTKRVFLKKGTCSRTFFYLLNRRIDDFNLKIFGLPSLRIGFYVNL